MHHPIHLRDLSRDEDNPELGHVWRRRAPLRTQSSLASIVLTDGDELDLFYIIGRKFRPFIRGTITDRLQAGGEVQLRSVDIIALEQLLPGSA